MANEKRLIDVTDALERLRKAASKMHIVDFLGIKAVDIGSVIQFLESRQTVDAVEVVHGYDTGRCRIFHCSECGYGVNDIFQENERSYPVGEFNYCPNCGAKMDGDGNA